MAGKRTDKVGRLTSRSGWVGELAPLENLPQPELLKPRDLGLNRQTVHDLERLVGFRIKAQALENLTQTIYFLKSYVVVSKFPRASRQDIRRTLTYIANELDDSLVLHAYQWCDVTTRCEVDAFLRRLIPSRKPNASEIRACAMLALSSFNNRSQSGRPIKGYRINIASAAKRLWFFLGGKSGPPIYVWSGGEEKPSKYLQFLEIIFRLTSDEKIHYRTLELLALRSRSDNRGDDIFP